MILFNPPKIAFEIPFFNLPIAWYGVLFALGFYFTSILFKHLCNLRKFSTLTPDQILNPLTTYMVVGIVLGARIVHLCFYESFRNLLEDPLILFRLREGGLASHGGILFCLMACWIFSRRYKLSFFELSDRIWVSALLLAVFIRVGNFINQEILGTQTDLPWGVVFLNPNSIVSDGFFPRHPVQIYEALFYLVLLISSYFLYKKVPMRLGQMSGLICFFLGTGRFFLEYFKEELSVLTMMFPIHMGQILSIPMIVCGLALFLYRKNKV